MKKIVLLLISMLIVMTMVSCSDDGNDTPTTSSAQNITNEMNSVMNDVVASEGVNAMMDNGETLDFLPFEMPMAKSMDVIKDRIYKQEDLKNFDYISKVLGKLEASPKQEERFIFADHLGTYTLTNVVYVVDEETGEEYVQEATWSIDYSNTTNIIVIIPAQYTDNGEEFRMELNAYQDQYLTWNDGEYDYYDWFPTEIDWDVFVGGTIVLGLDFAAEWAYQEFMEDVMPSYLDLTLNLPPFTIEITYSLDGVHESYAMSLTENSSTVLSVDIDLLYTDINLTDVDEVTIVYVLGNTTINMWASSDLDTVMESDLYTMQQKVDFIESRDYIYCDVFSGDTLIGELKARIYTYQDYDDYGNPITVEDIEPYIEFNDGSELGLEDMEGFMPAM